MSFLKFKYNALALVNAFLGVLVSVLLLINFGASGDTDAFFLIVSTVAALNMLQLSFVEQFMYFYNDCKVQSKNRASEFFVVMFCFSFSVGVIFFFLLYFFNDFLLKFFVLGIDTDRFEIMQQLFSILSFALIFYPVNFINDKLLNSEGYFAIPYVSEFMPFAVMSLVLLITFFNHQVTIYDVAYARLAGLAIGFFINLLLIYKAVEIKIKFNPKVDFFSCVKNSFFMRSAHNIHNFSVIPITNNILSSLTEGYASLYYYALRIIMVVKSVAVGPLYKVYIAKVSRIYSRNSLLEINASKLEFITVSIVLFIILAGLVFVFLPYMLGIIKIKNFLQDVDTLVLIYSSLFFWQLAMVIESPYVGIVMASKKSYVFYIVNTIFIFLYASCGFLLKNELGVYSLPMAGFLAQCVSVILFIKFSQHIMIKGVSEERQTR